MNYLLTNTKLLGHVSNSSKTFKQRTEQWKMRKQSGFLDRFNRFQQRIEESLGFIIMTKRC